MEWLIWNEHNANPCLSVFILLRIRAAFLDTWIGACQRSLRGLGHALGRRQQQQKRPSSSSTGLWMFLLFSSTRPVRFLSQQPIPKSARRLPSIARICFLAYTHRRPVNSRSDLTNTVKCSRARALTETTVYCKPASFQSPGQDWTKVTHWGVKVTQWGVKDAWVWA